LNIAVIEAGGFYEIENGNTSQVLGLDIGYDSVTPLSQWINPLVDWGGFDHISGRGQQPSLSLWKRENIAWLVSSCQNLGKSN